MAIQEHNVHQQVAIGITSGLFFLTTFVVYLRLYIRCFLLKAGSAGWDDLTVFVAWIMAMGASIATYFEISSGLGRHIQELRPDQLHGFNLSLFVVIQFYTIGLNFVKLSFLAQFHRIFPDPTIRRICMCFAFFCFLWMIVQSILYSFSCVPIQYLVPAMSAVCIPTLGIWTAISGVNVVTDAIIFCIPFRPLWRMPLLKRQRYLLIGIFCFGFLICVISIIRIPTLRHGASSPDPTFTNVTTGLWSLAELETAILCTSLPVLRPIVARFMRGVSPPDAGANQLRAGPERPDENKRGPKNPDDSLLNTTLTGSTLATRSFFRSLTTRDEDMEVGQPGLPAVSETKTEKLNFRQGDEKTSGTPKIFEVDYRKRDEEKGLDNPGDFFHRPTPEKATQKPPQIVPRDLRKEVREEPTWTPPPIPIVPESPQGSTRKLLHTPISPMSTDYSGIDTYELPSARTTDSFFKPRRMPGDESHSQDISRHTCSTSSEAFTREVCSMCSSELLPERLRSPALPTFGDQLHDASTQTVSSSKRRATTVQQGSDETVTHSTQTTIPWESSPESSRPPSPQRSEYRLDGDSVKQGTISRARERAMQAIADKTFGQVGEVHQGRARVIQVDTSQRRKAAIGLEEVMGLEVDRSPQRPVRPVQGQNKGMMASDGKVNHATAAAASNGRQVTDSELTPNQQEGDRGHGDSDVREVVPSSQSSTSQVNDARDHTVPIASATGRRAAGTSWLRLSTDFGS